VTPWPEKTTFLQEITKSVKWCGARNRRGGMLCWKKHIPCKSRWMINF